MSEASLESVLSGETANSAPVEAPEPAPIEGAVEQTGETTASPAGETEAVVSNEQPDDRTVPLAALKEERQRRQELERQMAEQKGRADAFAQVQQTQPSASEDPTKALEEKFYSDPVKFVQENLSTAMAQQRLELSEQFIRSTKDDAEEVLGAFIEMAKDNPSLVSQMNSHSMPAQFAYNAGKTYLETKEVGSIEELKAKLTREIRAEVEAELKKDKAVSAAVAATPTIAGARGAGATTAPGFSGPRPLSAILGD